MTVADKIAARQDQPRFTRDVRLVLDAAAFAKAQDLNHQLDQSIVAPDDDDVTVDGPIQIAEQLEVLHREHPPALFRFQACTPAEWTDLVADNEGEALWRELFAATCLVFEDEPVGPDDLTAELVGKYVETLTPGQWHTLREGMRALNEALFDLRPTSAAYAVLQRMRPNLSSATDD